MSSTNKYGTIKTIIRKKENPSSYDAVGLLTKLSVAHRTLMSIKFHYNDDNSTPPTIIMAPLTMKTKQAVPKWFTRLIPALEQLLDVAIIRDKRLIDNYIEPVYSLTIIGEEQMAILTTHYIDTIYTTITRLVARKREHWASKNKKTRKLNRINRTNHPTYDAREKASQLKETIILSILKTINTLLETAHRDYPVSYGNGIARRLYIEEQLKLKYTKTWRSGLSTRFG